MKKLITLVALFTIFSGHAIFLDKCNNTDLRTGQGVSFRFESCIDRNFWDIESYTHNTRFKSCDNMRFDRVSSFYVRCINDNFSKVSFEIPGSFIKHCFQFDRDKLEVRFIDCVNDNFDNIERAIRLRR